MSSLISATALFLGMHWIISGSPLRDPIVAAIGEKPFKILFSITIAGSITWMSFAYGDAEYRPTWGTAEGLKPVSLVLIALSLIMIFLGVFSNNANTNMSAQPDEIEVRGVVRITRHTAVFGLGLWGLGHFIVNGDVASHIFFGSFAFQGLVAPLNMDRKFRRRYGEAWEQYCAKTSYIPFGAILSGRNRLMLSEINWIASLGGVLVFALFFYFHESWFGVAAFV